ncbi:CsgG/HfaB family protein [Polaromonas sp. SM01]|uniref:CsgG/HfaB family protein n=1 Tax=Polaromonas sp. SM01 TaxID=3085630 RepID=UPI0029811090|nr:CsgG/HfaB family protein [Polaromonas sp. SM01]MDW5441125.1 CsgG/HfaB family protein [Polaromonas sp. SM01]
MIAETASGRLGRLGLPVAMALVAGLSGCAVQTPPLTQMEAPQALATQKAAQQAVMAQAPAAPTLKRKIALGRITNETNYGQSLLRDRSGDPLGKQVSDLMSKALTESGAYLVFERPDIGRIQAEGRLTDTKLNLVGVDALVIGSLTEFGRKTVGASGFVSSSKRQVAFAKVDVRAVDVNTGHVFFAASGAGEASTETASTFGFGSQAGYDGTLNDAAVRQAVAEAVSRLSVEMRARPWQTYILKADGNRVFLGGGKSQGIKPGMQFSVHTQGEQVKSPQTGAIVTLPGQLIALVRVDALFGDNELNEGSVASMASGSLGSYRPDQLLVRYEGAQP